MEDKNIKHLTPEMVRELKELGIEFTETQMMWIHTIGYGFKLAPADFTNKDSVELGLIKPAPNLQEVLEILPSHVEMHSKKLYITNDGKDSYLARYNNVNCFKHTNPLLAAFELLKWVAKNHPETLK